MNNPRTHSTENLSNNFSELFYEKKSLFKLDFKKNQQEISIYISLNINTRELKR
jgi:hypothetical protein